MPLSRTKVALAAAVLLAGCGGGGSAGPSAPQPPPPPVTAKAGIAVPTELSALPAKVAAAASGSATLRALAGAGLLSLPATSDYALAPSAKYVDERALSQFDVFNTIFGALAQTHYADPENVGAGPYGAIVSWEENHGDSQSKKLIPWVVDSSLVTVDGRAANRVLAWMPMEMGDGLLHLIKIRVDVFAAPTQRADGSYADYGEWRIDAKFGEDASQYFAASATRAGDGSSVVMLREVSSDGETAGVLRRADAAGSGKVTYPSWERCDGPGCTPELATVAYVYDAAHAALQRAGQAPVFKDRSAVVDLVQRYGLYDATTGDDVARTHQFGFPLRYTDGAGRERYAYYGAWQGRHQLWADGQPLPAGTVVRRGDRTPGAAPVTFTASAPFVGTLVKRTLAPADVQDVRGLVVETWVNESRLLRWDGAKWVECVSPAYGQNGQTCASTPDFTDFASIAFDPNDRRRNVWIGAQTNGPGQPQPLVWVNGGFFLATDSNGQLQPTGAPFAPSAGQQLWVNVSGSVYISFDGEGWVQKKLVSFDDASWTPTFDPAGDRIFTPELERELYVNSAGVNYVVKRTAAGYDVKIELQTAVNPSNASSILPAGAELRPQWGGAGGSTYAFVTDPADPAKFLKLVYRTVGSDAPASAAQGAVVEAGQWGLVAYAANGAALGFQMNWDYPRQGETYGIQQFLVKGDGSYQLLDDPIRLAPVTLANGAGAGKPYALQFDGSWVNGLPNLWDELRRANFDVTGALAAKIVLIPAGTEVTDASDPSRRYVFKPLQTAEYLTTIADPGDLDLGPANALDLAACPRFVEHGMGPTPDVPVKYSEGKPVR